jgi:hypothetical protein
MGGQPYLVKIRSSVSKLVLFVSIEIDTHAMRMLTSWQPADKRASARSLLVDWCALDCTPQAWLTSRSHHMSCCWWTSYKIHIQPTTDFSRSTVASVLTDAPFIQPVVSSAAAV